MDMIIELMPQMMEGFGMTLKIFAMTLVLAIPLGMVIAVGRLSKLEIIKWITGAYVLVLRGTPLMLQIIFIFYGLPMIGVTFDRFPAAIIALVLNYAAYFAEIFRSGIQSIDKGQVEGAHVLGLTSSQTFFRIILPQAFKRILPPVSNEIITLVKDTALVYVVGLDELLKVGNIALNRTSSLMPLVIVGVIYLTFIGLLTKVLAVAEKKFNYYE